MRRVYKEAETAKDTETGEWVEYNRAYGARETSMGFDPFGKKAQAFVDKATIIAAAFAVIYTAAHFVARFAWN